MFVLPAAGDASLAADSWRSRGGKGGKKRPTERARAAQMVP